MTLVQLSVDWCRMHAILCVYILLHLLSFVCGNRKGDMNNETLKYYRSIDSLDNFDDPTREELNRAYLIKPSLEWGSIFRHQKSIRFFSFIHSLSYLVINWYLSILDVCH